MKKEFIEKEIKSKVKINFSYSEIEGKVNLNRNELNKKVVFNCSKKNIYKKLMFVCLSFLFIVGIVSIIVNLNKLVYDYEKGIAASKIIENAQYVPDMDKFLEVNKQLEQVNMRNKRMKSITSTSKMTNEEFANLIDECATFNSESGAGKYLGYDIYEIKKEIKFVVDNVPAFDQWFRMPIMREDEGFIKIPYYENWSYYLEYDEETSNLSITRVSWCTRSKYLDYENQITVEEHDDGTSFVQYEIMKINYYYNVDNKEVVECYGYNVGIDNVKNAGTCNQNINDYYPFEYRYLKNVEDESLIKYHIVAAERFREDDSFDQGGMDIRGLYPYGSSREFLIINYDGYKEIVTTRINQKYNSSLDNKFSLNDANIKYLAKSVGLDENELNGFNSNNEFIDVLCKKIVDEFELKNNWPIIYKDSLDAYEIDKIYGQYYQKEILISDLSHLASCRSHSRNEIEYSASADIYDINKFDVDKKYSLSVALKKDDGTIYILGSDYEYLEKVNYAGSTEKYYYRIHSDINILTDDKNSPLYLIKEPGTYVLTTVLTYHNNGKEEILFDTLENVLLADYHGLSISDYHDDSGIVYTYKVKGIEKKLEIIVNIK